MKEDIRKMLLLLQNVLYCLLYASLIKCAVRNDGRNCLYFYPKEYIEEAQKRGIADKETVMKGILGEIKQKEADRVVFKNEQLYRFFPSTYVKYNKYGRTEELYECESCEGCQHKQECCPRAHKNRTIRMNQELTAIHQEVLQNLESIHGALLRMNRSIHSEGTFGVLKWDKAYKRLLRRGEKNVILELTLISCGFNLYKYHNKKQRQTKVA